MRHFRTLVGIFAFSGGLVSAAGAQVDPNDPREGFLSGVSAPWDRVDTDCMTELQIRTTAPVHGIECSVVSRQSMGQAQGWEWHVVRYLRHAMVAYDEFDDSLSIDELVLLARRPGADTASLRWHIRSVREFDFLMDPVWADTDDGVFLELSVCLNGTGGCREEYMRLINGRWRVLKQEFLDSLRARVPEGYRMHHGRRLDLQTMRGVQWISKPEDPNCCPSGRLDFRVRLEGERLRLLEATAGLPTEHYRER
jgi:hypothetical protein